MGTITLEEYSKSLQNNRILKIDEQQKIVYTCNQDLDRSRDSNKNTGQQFRILKYKQIEGEAELGEIEKIKEQEGCLKVQEYSIERLWGRNYLRITFYNLNNQVFESLNVKQLHLYSPGFIRRIINFLLITVHNFHRRHLIIRDLSLSSIFFSTPNQINHVKQIKFAYFDYNLDNLLDKLKERKGEIRIPSKYFLAPEQLQKQCQFTKYTDAWALGIIIITLSLRIPPNQLADQLIPAKDINFPSEELKQRIKDPRVRIILNILLNRNQKKRSLEAVFVQLKKFPSLDLSIEYCKGKEDFCSEVKQIGDGGYATVYSAKLNSAKKKREVAIKEVFTSNYLTQFDRELRQNQLQKAKKLIMAKEKIRSSMQKYTVKEDKINSLSSADEGKGKQDIQNQIQDILNSRQLHEETFINRVLRKFNLWGKEDQNRRVHHFINRMKDKQKVKLLPLQSLLREVRILNDLNTKFVSDTRQINTVQSEMNQNPQKPLTRQIFVHLKKCYVTQSHQTVYMVMQKCNGDLYKSILECEYDMDQKMKHSRHLISCLQRLHENGYVHRDIKPENILEKDGNLLFSDFGISKKIQKSNSKRQSTNKNSGTLQYMHPELKKIGFGKKYKRYDWYSLGLVIIELWAGIIPDKANLTYSLEDLHKIFRPDQQLAQKVFSFINSNE